MAKDTLTLPTSEDSEISLVLYENMNETIKSRINFTQHVFSFLIDGYKEIYNAQSPNYLSGKEFALVTTPNCLMTEKKTAELKPYRSILLFFSNKVLEEFKLTHRDLIRENHSEKPLDVLTFPYDRYCHAFRSSLQLLLTSGQALQPELIKTKFNEIMLYLLRTEPEMINILLSNTQHDRGVVFKATIENNLYAQLDLEELAFLCNMSLSTFKRHFKAAYGMSPKKYLTHKNLEMADYLLKKGDRPNQVYEKAGYSTLSNFIKAYKAHFGKTPTS